MLENVNIELPFLVRYAIIIVTWGESNIERVKKMKYILLFMLLAINFAISWANASYVGRYWSESKKIGGSFRREIICGYVMAIAGFTMVYGYILLMAAPFFLQLLEVDPDVIMRVELLASDLLYLLVGVPIVLSGVRIWLTSLRRAWEERSFAYLATAGWNSYAQIHNMMSFARQAPSAFGRVVEVLFGGSKSRSSSKKKGDALIVYLAIIVVVAALLGGYFTADAIMKRADAEYDAFAYAEQRRRQQRGYY